ncbi:MAG: hydroxymethylglutaryl-CoA lyase, partial [Acidimicrobiia bacterium]|nr:hydroxymethylglutaryl-CoA lyase [Acidimicrobiia bacterium]
MDPVDIREVGPRDGLQAEHPVAVEDRVRLIEALIDAGVRQVEACSFVSPRAVPSMAGAADVMGRVPRAPEYHYAALVP